MLLQVDGAQVVPYSREDSEPTTGQKPLVGRLVVVDEGTENLLIRLKDPVTGEPLVSLELFRETEAAQFGATRYVVASNRDDAVGYQIRLPSPEETSKLAKIIKSFRLASSKTSTVGSRSKNSVFHERTDDASAAQYFQFYGYLSQQQNMMQDFIRTSTYQRAIHANLSDFKDKVVLDVGAGSGILSFFALQAGARKVYAVEASSMAKHAEALVRANGVASRIIVLAGKVEEITLPEKVDVIISEPMGYMLFNERMLESYLYAKRWLRNPSSAKMYPSKGDLHIAPFSDAALYMEQMNKASFWLQTSFHGVDLSSLKAAAVSEYFRQPVVDTFDVRICTAKPITYSVDFLTAHEDDLQRMDIDLEYQMTSTCEVHGLAFWFDVAFAGTDQSVWLSTSPTQPLTHWYQVRCLLERPFYIERGQTLRGKVVLHSNKRQSYDVDIKLVCPSTGETLENTIDLKNPTFRYTGQAPQPPPGSLETSPTEQYWSTTVAPQTNGSASLENCMGAVDSSLVNGASVHPAVLNGGGANIGIDQLNSTLHSTHVNYGLNAINYGSSVGNTISAVTNQSPRISTNAHQQASHVTPVSSIGGGISPALFTTTQTLGGGGMGQFPVSSGLMIGDYAAAGGVVPVQHTQQPNGFMPYGHT